MAKNIFVDGRTYRSKAVAFAVALVMVLTAIFALPLTASAAEGDVVGQGSIKQGDIIYYGHYPQEDIGTVGSDPMPSGTDGTDYVIADTTTAFYSSDQDGDHYFAIKPIAWKVLSNVAGKLFLLAQDGLDTKPYNTAYIVVTWETSTVRSWLNGYLLNEAGASVSNPHSDSFMDTAFTSEEQGFITSTAVDNPNNPTYGTAGGNPTTDKIFFLKLEDTINPAYFGLGVPPYGSATTTRAIAPTGYAKAHGAFYITSSGEYNGKANWWLRSPGDSLRAVYVGNSGNVDDLGESFAIKYDAVRPALNLSNLESLIFTSTGAEGSYNVTIKHDVPKSSDAALKSLTVSEGTLTPAFSPAVTGYTVSVAKSVESITLTAAANHAKATVVGAGAKALSVGKNTFTIALTAEDGTAKNYTVAVTRDGGEVKDGATQTETPQTANSIPAVSVPTAPNGTADLPKTIDFGGGFKDDVTWTSADTGIAGIDANGDLVGVSEGTVTLTATSKSDLTRTVTITVTIAKNVTAIRSPIKTLYVKKGKAITPPVDFDGKDADGKVWGYRGYGTAPKLTWKSGKPSVAAVDAKTGKITPKKKGTAKITAKSLNGKSYTFTVKVVAKAKKLSKAAIAKPPKTLKVGKTIILKLKLTSAKATNINVTFKSNKPSIIRVDKAGKLFALKKGTAKITVKAGGKRKVITVKVK